jgi:sulfite reductase beta subunit
MLSQHQRHRYLEYHDFGDGFIRFTIRSNVEFMVDTEAKVNPLIEALESAGFPVGGTGPTVISPLAVVTTHSWVHVLNRIRAT